VKDPWGRQKRAGEKRFTVAGRKEERLSVGAKPIRTPAQVLSKKELISRDRGVLVTGLASGLRTKGGIEPGRWLNRMSNREERRTNWRVKMTQEKLIACGILGGREKR